MMRTLAAVLVLLVEVGLGRAGEEEIHKALKDAGVQRMIGYSPRFGVLESLRFDGVQGTDALLGELCELRQVTQLIFYRSDLTDAGMAYVGDLRGLLYLSLSSTAITDTGLSRLKGSSALTGLDLEKCRNLTDAGLEPLTRLSKLTYLDLRGCPNITDAGVARLQKALPKCEIKR
jgi:hypothetical protein